MRIGVLALQGAFVEHIAVLERIGAVAVPVRLPAHLVQLDGLIIPGGESTTITRLMAIFGLTQPIRQMAGAGLPIFGTCAGMICLATKVHPNKLDALALMDMEVSRNAFGRQVDSFEADIAVPALGERPFKAIFIRAPLIEKVGANAEVLACLPNGIAVAARQGNLLATAFHPELTADTRFHEYFLKTVSDR